MSSDLLLDTHALIWLASGDARAGALVGVLDDPASTVSVSAISWMEIAIKHAIGKLDVDVASTRVKVRLVNAIELPVTGNHAEALAQLPLHHTDPFDRMLIAQALAEDMTIATIDPAFSAYEGLKVIWP